MNNDTLTTICKAFLFILFDIVKFQAKVKWFERIVQIVFRDVSHSNDWFFRRKTVKNKQWPNFLLTSILLLNDELIVDHTSCCIWIRICYVRRRQSEICLGDMYQFSRLFGRNFRFIQFDSIEKIYFFLLCNDINSSEIYLKKKIGYVLVLFSIPNAISNYFMSLNFQTAINGWGSGV